jgi:hypothetical protein
MHDGERALQSHGSATVPCRGFDIPVVERDSEPQSALLGKQEVGYAPSAFTVIAIVCSLLSRDNLGFCSIRDVGESVFVKVQRFRDTADPRLMDFGR